MRLRTGAAVLALSGLTWALAGCSDSTEVVTFTDVHGRVCTGSVIIDGDGDREVTAIDCDYPPEGKSPGSPTYQELPKR